jgi:hypothetical protein
MVEWGILAIVVFIVAGIFGRYAHRVQGQAERAAIVFTLGALRTALVVGHTRQLVANQQQVIVTAVVNPFDWFESRPANYAGPVHSRNVDAVAPGKWVFDAECPCVGYVPLQPEWLEYPAYAPALWFRVISGKGVPQLEAWDSYQWQGAAVN